MAGIGPGTTLGMMLEQRIKAYASCPKCGEKRDVDIVALIGKVGHEYSLWNRRCRCRITSGCTGWNHFKIGGGWAAPAYDSATQARWMEQDSHEREHGAPEREAVVLPKQRMKGPKGWLPGGTPMEQGAAIEILQSACGRAAADPVKTTQVRQALTALKPLCRTGEMLGWFWECADSPNEIGRHQNLSAALNGILRQLGLPTE